MKFRNRILFSIWGVVLGLQVVTLAIIYYWVRADEQIFLLTLYGKGEKEDLSAAELKRIVKLVEELK